MIAVANPGPPLSVRGAFSALRIPTAADVLFSTKAAAAVVLSLFIGFSQGLENPYWSVVTVYVLLSQPQAGAIRSKALFRLGGTVLGGVSAIVLASLLGSHVGVLLAATVFVVLAFCYVRVLDRTPVNYMWISAALALAVIVVPRVQSPAVLFMTAMTRMAEICLAILMIGLIDAIVAPRPATPAFVQFMAEWRGRAAKWASDALQPGGLQATVSRDAHRAELHGLAGLIVPLDAISAQLPYDIVARPPRGRDLRFLRLTVARLIAQLAAAEVWVEVVRAEAGSIPSLEAEFAEIRAWLNEQAAIAEAGVVDHANRGLALLDRLRLIERHGAATGDADLLRRTTLGHLCEMLDQWVRLERVLHTIATGAPMADALVLEATRASPVRSIDYVLGLLDLAPLILALSFTVFLWYVTAWTSGAFATLIAFVSLVFILGTPSAERSARGIAVWIATAYVIDFFYLFAVLPRVTAFPVLMGVLLIAMVPLGLVMAMSPAGMLILVTTFTFLGLQDAYVANFGATLENFLGSMSGCLIAILSLHLCQFDRPRFSARRLANALRRDVVITARARRLPDRARLVTLSVDRMAQYFGAADALPADDPLHAEALVDTLRVTMNIVRLHAREPALSPAARTSSARLRAGYARQYRGRTAVDRPALIALTDAAFAAVRAEPHGSAKFDALSALTGLRVSLTAETAIISPAQDGAK